MIPLHRCAEVAKAHRDGTPIVALESTIITHGMPYPQNLEVARQVEADVRAAGATPATIAVIGLRYRKRRLRTRRLMRSSTRRW